MSMDTVIACIVCALMGYTAGTYVTEMRWAKSLEKCAESVRTFLDPIRGKR